MQFRYLAVITLWTCLSGPIFGGLSASSFRPTTEQPVVAAPAQGPHTWHSSTEKHRRRG